MAWVKALHVISLFIWIGTLLSLTRLMGYHVKEEPDTQMRMAKIYKRMYRLVQFPTMIVAIVLGVVLLTQLDLSYKPGWLHMKLTFAAGLIICDWMCGRNVARLNVEPDLSKGVRYKMLHGITGLMLIGVLVAGIAIRDKKGEILHAAGIEQPVARAVTLQ